MAVPWPSAASPCSSRIVGNRLPPMVSDMFLATVSGIAQHVGHWALKSKTKELPGVSRCITTSVLHPYVNPTRVIIVLNPLMVHIWFHDDFMMILKC